MSEPEPRRPAPASPCPTGHTDLFCREALPPRELWPELDLTSLPELAYPPRLNCAVELLDANLEAGREGRTAVRSPDTVWTYGELAATSNRIARALIEDLGMVPGHRVLLRGPNNPMMVACWLAVLKAGGVVVTTMPLLRVRELAYIADKAKVTLALTDARVAADCEAAMASPAGGAHGGVRVVRFGDDGPGSLESLLRGKPATFDPCPTAADDPALIAFTSGTTGNAKGTVHFHRDVMAVTDCFPPYVLKPTPDDLFCGSPPLAFTYGLGGLVLFPFRVGASTLLLEQASPPQLLAGIEAFGATISFTAPTAYRAMTERLAQYDVSCLRECVSAGETLPLAVFNAWREATGVRIIDGIGTTELLHMFISAGGDDIRPGATGRVVPGYRARVVDAEGREVPTGTIGNLVVQGPTGCRYLADPERQRAYVRDGWNWTGDAYKVDADGYFWYQARTDDMIISSGYNISGPEVEAALLDHPAVAECGVVGAPDPERGRIIKAFVVLREGHAAGPELVEEMQAFVKREIAPYKYPRAIEFVESLPRTLTGKLQRYRLRERAGDR
jgi:2-aminobenzoate-CoA ligase